MSENTLLIITGTLVALGAGVFFGFAIGIVGALGRQKDTDYIRFMQSINKSIENPIFGLTLIGPAILLPILTYMARSAEGDRFELLLTASVLYIVGTILLSLVGNVPLNTKLARFNVSRASAKEVADTRASIEKPWAFFNTLRTVAAIATTVLLFAVVTY